VISAEAHKGVLRSGSTQRMRNGMPHNWRTDDVDALRAAPSSPDRVRYDPAPHIGDLVVSQHPLSPYRTHHWYVTCAMTQENIRLADKESRYTSLDWSIHTGNLEALLHVVSRGRYFSRHTMRSQRRSASSVPVKHQDSRELRGLLDMLFRVRQRCRLSSSSVNGNRQK
jgi:hypothetical protein